MAWHTYKQLSYKSIRSTDVYWPTIHTLSICSNGVYWLKIHTLSICSNGVYWLKIHTLSIRSTGVYWLKIHTLSIRSTSVYWLKTHTLFSFFLFFGEHINCLFNVDCFSYYMYIVFIFKKEKTDKEKGNGQLITSLFSTTVYHFKPL